MKYKCDLCNKECRMASPDNLHVDEGRLHFEIRTCHKDTFHGVFINAHLCEKCSEKIKDALSAVIPERIINKV